MSYQTQESLQLTGHTKKLAFSNFHNTMDSLENYVEKMGKFPDFHYRRQRILARIGNRSTGGSLGGLADDFLTQLYLLKAIVHKKPGSLGEDMRKEFYKWIDHAAITVNNCPRELAHFLIEVNNVVTNKNDKIVKEANDFDDGKAINMQGVMGMFGAIQQPLNNNREQRELFNNKAYDEVKVEEFDGDEERGRQAFEQIASVYAREHQGFNLFSQVNEQQRIDTNMNVNAFPNRSNAFPSGSNAFPRGSNAFPSGSNAFPDGY